MRHNDRIEFYLDGKLFASVASSMVPPIDAWISIRKRTFRVAAITYALDHADDFDERGMRANIDVIEVKP